MARNEMVPSQQAMEEARTQVIAIQEFIVQMKNHLMGYKACEENYRKESKEYFNDLQMRTINALGYDEKLYEDLIKEELEARKYEKENLAYYAEAISEGEIRLHMAYMTKKAYEANYDHAFARRVTDNDTCASNAWSRYFAVQKKARAYYEEHAQVFNKIETSKSEYEWCLNY